MQDDANYPSEEELAALPAQAIAALSTRCARRLVPLFEISWVQAPSDLVVALWEGVTRAESLCAGDRTGLNGDTELIKRAMEAANEANERIAARVASCVLYTNWSAEAVYPPLGDRSLVATAAHDAIFWGGMAAADVGMEAETPYGITARYTAPEGSLYVQAVAYDYKRLRAAANNGELTLAVRVTPNSFGPLWPHGKPNWERRRPRGDRSLLLPSMPEDDASASTRGSYAFISYVREDRRLVDRLATVLKSRGVAVWLDRESITPGMRWKDAIRRAIRRGSFFIACFSENYERRERAYMNEELLLAIEQLRLFSPERAWFIPVLLSPCRVPDYEIGPGSTIGDLHRLELYEDWERGGLGARGGEPCENNGERRRVWLTRACT